MDDTQLTPCSPKTAMPDLASLAAGEMQRVPGQNRQKTVEPGFQAHP